MAKINHPCIVRFIGYSPNNFLNEDKPVIITELLTCGTLENVIESERKSLALPLWDATHKLINIYGIAVAMEFLHSHGIIHRDLKPANILMDESLYPKVADFGLSKKIDSEEQDSLNVQSTATEKGTPIYMSPEILTQNKYTPACDVYAFAMIVYEIMSNEIPFKNYNMFNILTKVPSGDRPNISDSIPKAYQILIESCWEQNPDERPPFNEIVQVLRENKGFITDLVDENEYLDYIEYIEKNHASYDKSKKIKSLGKQKPPEQVKIIEDVSDEINITSNLPIQLDKSHNKSDQKISSQHSPNIAPGISEKKAIFESRSGDLTNKEPKQEPKFGLRANNNPNSKATANRSAIQSQIVTSNNKIVPNDNSNSNNKSREVPLISSTNDNLKIKEKETPSAGNRNSDNSNKYKESLKQKIAMFNSSHSIIYNFKKEEPKKEEPKKEEPKKEEPKKEEPKKEEPKKEEPKKSEPKKEEPNENETNENNDKIEKELAEKKYLDLNKFKLGKLIDKGGFGKVYRCQNTMTGEKCAAKISINPVNEEDKNAMLNIYREVNIMASISHPAVLKFIGYSPVNFNGKKKPVIINEFASNGSLKDIIFQIAKGKKIQGWDATKKLINVYGIAAGMAFLHLNRVVHRDLKPENILLDDYLFPKISDFGLAKQIHENEQSVTMESQVGIKGTILYLSPELIENPKAYSEASDVYAYGLILYELYNGQFQYKGNYMMLPSQVLGRWRPDIKKQVPEAYKDLIVKCWSQNPSDRLTFQEIVYLLENDSSFLTNDVNKEDFRKYVDFIKHSQSSYDKGKKIIELKGPSFQKVSINQNDESEE
ncbi:hypothetical protein M9Y10_025288 [Tritrichomonas musculus]|uniref:Protein kinase domain-containing protein n=1 Tax=Tritrichomonas musculus TaxID=1915356 RepID=A0ABR2HB00_9EUKA